MSIPYKEEIDRVARIIKTKATPQIVGDLKEFRVQTCLMSLDIKTGGRLRGLVPHTVQNKTNTSYRYQILVSFYETPRERLVTLIHELFHIPYIEKNSIPRHFFQEASHEYIEKVIDELAYWFVDAYPEWTAEMFEKWFGMRHTDWVIID